MLPLTTAENDHAARNGQLTLQPILYSEVAKARLFEITLVSPVQLERWTGRERWKQDDELPADFLVRLKEATTCDAVLFSQLTYFRPYPPLAVGWRLLLVRTNGDVVWSVDEVFDAGDPAVVNSVRRYVLEHERTSAEIAKEVRSRPGALWSTKVAGMEWLNSPRQFARYTANATVETLSIK